METLLNSLFEDFAQMHIGVVGDVMLDTYWWGEVDRISPEAPVPVVSVKKREKRIGGAGNVALNLEKLGAKTALITMLGEDEDGKELKGLLEENNIDTSFILESPRRVTTNKIRIIARNQQMMRLDAEITRDLETEDEVQILSNIRNYIDSIKPHVIIFEDYNKGLLTEEIIRKVISYCNEKGIITTVDPKRKNFFSYQNVTLFKPNLSEVITALNRLPQSLTTEMLEEIHKSVKEKLDHSISLITLSENGVFYQKDNQRKIYPSYRRNIADVSGAGDTVIAVASLTYAASKDIDLAARIANIAGGIVCEEVGTVPVNKQKLLAECKRLLS